MGTLDKNGFAPCPWGLERPYIENVIKVSIIEQICLGESVQRINEAIWDMMPAHEVSPQEFTLWLLAFQELQGGVND